MPSGPRNIQGDATDTAILRFSDFVSSADVTREHFKTIFTQSFSSATKFAIKVLAYAEAITDAERLAMPILENSYIMMVKGAPDVLLQRSSYFLDPVSGKPLPLTPESRMKIVATQEKWAAGGRRVLLLARRHILIPKHDPESPGFADYVAAEHRDLEVVGLVGIIDPPREDIPQSIRTCREAGIRVFMVTGDFRLTAAAIAEKCGIISNASHVDG